MSDKCPCGGIILADTEDWKTPLCYNCYTDLHEGYSAMSEKHTDALKLIEEMAGALKYYGGIDCDSDAYLDVFDCITRESDSVTNFDSDKFSLKARDALESYRKFKGE